MSKLLRSLMTYLSTNIPDGITFDRIISDVIRYNPEAIGVVEIRYDEIVDIYSGGTLPSEPLGVLDLLPTGVFRVLDLPSNILPPEYSDFTVVNLYRWVDTDTIDNNYTYFQYDKIRFSITGIIGTSPVWINETNPDTSGTPSKIYYITEPTNPTEGTLWVSLNNGSYAFKVYLDGEWKEQSSDEFLPKPVYDKNNIEKPIDFATEEALDVYSPTVDKFTEHIENKLPYTHASAEDKVKISNLIDLVELTAMFAEGSDIYNSLISFISTTVIAISKSGIISEDYQSIVAELSAHIATHITEEDVIRWNNKSPGDHRHDKDGRVTIDGEYIDSSSVPFKRENLQEDIYERIIKITNIDVLESATPEEIATIYHGGNTLWIDGDPPRLFKITDSTKIGTPDYINGVVEIVFSVDDISFNDLTGLPTTAEGFGITDMLVSKDDIQNVITEANSTIDAIESSPASPIEIKTDYTNLSNSDLIYIAHVSPSKAESTIPLAGSDNYINNFSNSIQTYLYRGKSVGDTPIKVYRVEMGVGTEVADSNFTNNIILCDSTLNDLIGENVTDIGPEVVCYLKYLYTSIKYQEKLWYMTQDGGNSWFPISVPWDTETELSIQPYVLEIENYVEDGNTYNATWVLFPVNGKLYVTRDLLEFESISYTQNDVDAYILPFFSGVEGDYPRVYYMNGDIFEYHELKFIGSPIINIATQDSIVIPTDSKPFSKYIDTLYNGIESKYINAYITTDNKVYVMYGEGNFIQLGGFDESEELSPKGIFITIHDLYSENIEYRVEIIGGSKCYVYSITELMKESYNDTTSIVNPVKVVDIPSVFSTLTTPWYRIGNVIINDNKFYCKNGTFNMVNNSSIQSNTRLRYLYNAVVNISTDNEIVVANPRFAATGSGFGLVEEFTVPFDSIFGLSESDKLFYGVEATKQFLVNTETLADRTSIHEYLDVNGNNATMHVYYDSGKLYYRPLGINGDTTEPAAMTSTISTRYNYGEISFINNWLNKHFNLEDFESIYTYNWKLTPQSSAVETLDGVSYANDKFFLYNSGNPTIPSNKLLYSTDAETWTKTTLPMNGYWSKVVYGASKYLIISKGTSKYAYSTDGINWTMQDMGSGLLADVAYGDSRFVIITSGGGAWYSSNGTSWTAIATVRGRYLNYVNGGFIASSWSIQANNGHGYKTSNITYCASNDGISWMVYIYGHGLINSMTTIGYVVCGDKLIACGSPYNFYTYDMMKWYPIPLLNNSNADYVRGIAYFNYRYYIITENKLLQTVDFNTIKTLGQPNPFTEYRAIYTNGQSLIISAIPSDGSGGIYFYSTNGTTWSATGEYISWTDQEDVLYSTSYGFVRFVVYGSKYAIETSSNGYSWNERHSISNSSINMTYISRLVYGNGIYLFVYLNQISDQLCAYYSTNITTWSIGIIENNWDSTGLDDLVFGNGLFVCSRSAMSGVYTSSNGSTWTYRAKNSNAGQHINYFQGKYIVGDERFEISTNTTTWVPDSYIGVPEILQLNGSQVFSNMLILPTITDNILVYQSGIWRMYDIDESLSNTWGGIIVRNGKGYLTSPINSRTISTTNGTTWVEEESFFGNTSNFVAYSTNVAVSAADRNYVITVDDAGNVKNAQYNTDPLEISPFVIKSDSESDTTIAMGKLTNISRRQDNSLIWESIGLGSTIGNSYITSLSSLGDNWIITTKESEDNLTPTVYYSTDNGTSYATRPVSIEMPIISGWHDAVAYDGGYLAVTASAISSYARSSDGQNWELIRILPEGVDVGFNCIAYGNGVIFVIYSGSNNKGAYSTNGINFTEVTLPSVGSWYTVCYGTRFVAISYGSNLGAYSSNGVSWTQMTMPSSSYWRDVCYGVTDGRYVAVASGTTTAAYSTNGYTWTASTMPSSANWYKVVYGNGTFIAVTSSTGTTAAYSTTGTTWVAKTISSLQIYAIGFVANTLVFIGRNTDKLYYQTNPTTNSYLSKSFEDLQALDWRTIISDDTKGILIEYNGSGRALSIDSSANISTTKRYPLDIRDSTANNNGYVAIGNSPNGIYSSDGINFSTNSLPSNRSWTSIASGPDSFMMVSDNEDKAVSVDGRVWNVVDSKMLPVNTGWYSVCYGNDKYVAVSSNSTIAAYSTDGINWTQSTLPVSDNWRTVCYGNGKYVAVCFSSSGISAYSTDGINWTQSTLPVIDNWYSVCYGNGKYVAIPYNNSIIAAYSTDGINWTQSTLPVNAGWYSVCYGNDKYVAIGTATVYSTDGINWTQSTLPVSTSWMSVCYGNGKYVAIANNSNISAYSTDGINWTQSTLPISRVWRSICYGNGKYVAIAYNTDASVSSTDGINWTQSTLPVSVGWYSVCYGNDKYITVAINSNIAAYSTDGDEWVASIDNNTGNPGLPVSANWTSLCYGNGKYVAITRNSNTSAYSTDGINWTQSTLPVSATWTSLCYGDGKYVAISESNSNIAAYSTDGINWTQSTLPVSAYWTSLCYGNDKYVAVSSVNSNISSYSTDGITWTQSTLPVSANWYSVCYGNGKYVAVALLSDVSAYSIDGINWTQSTLPANTDWISVCFGNGKYVTITSSSNIAAYSTDGINWTQSTLPVSARWNSVCYGNGKYVAVTYRSNISAYSTDGINWTQSTLPVNADWREVCYGNGKYVAVAGGTDNSNISAYSTDGINWLAANDYIPSKYNSIDYVNGKYIICYTAESDEILYSEDLGISWKTMILPLSKQWSGISHGNDKYVIFSKGTNIFLYSEDFVNWYQLDGKTTADVMTFDGTKFITMNSNNTNFSQFLI